MRQSQEFVLVRDVGARVSVQRVARVGTPRVCTRAGTPLSYVILTYTLITRDFLMPVMTLMPVKTFMPESTVLPCVY